MKSLWVKARERPPRAKRLASTHFALLWSLLWCGIVSGCSQYSTEALVECGPGIPEEIGDACLDSSSQYRNQGTEPDSRDRSTPNEPRSNRFGHSELSDLPYDFQLVGPDEDDERVELPFELRGSLNQRWAPFSDDEIAAFLEAFYRAPPVPHLQELVDEYYFERGQISRFLERQSESPAQDHDVLIDLLWQPSQAPYAFAWEPVWRPSESSDNNVRLLNARPTFEITHR